MALNKNEKLLVENIRTMLQHDAKLGLSMHDENSPEAKQDWRGLQYLHEQIDDMFLYKASELTHSDAVTSAFRKVHGYKYLSDWTFLPAFEREMVARAVPIAERAKSMQFIPDIIEELKSEKLLWSEIDAGMNPNLEEVMDVSRPEQDIEFNIEDRPLNKKNVELPKHGDGSPAKLIAKPPMPGDSHEPELGTE